MDGDRGWVSIRSNTGATLVEMVDEEAEAAAEAEADAALVARRPRDRRGGFVRAFGDLAAGGGGGSSGDTARTEGTVCVGHRWGHCSTVRRSSRFRLLCFLHHFDRCARVRDRRMEALKAAPYRLEAVVDSARLGNLKRGELFVVEEILEVHRTITSSSLILF